MHSTTTPMRLAIAKHLSETDGDEDFTFSLLDLYDLEKNGEVKVQASIAYHSKLKSSGKDLTRVIERLKETIVCYGPDYQERRQAAFCGLVILERLDIMVDAKERIGSERLVGIDTIRGLVVNIPLNQFVLGNWDYLKDYFKADFWARLFRHSEPSYYTWKNLAQLADKYESPKQELLEFLLSYKPKIGDSNLLLFLSRVAPASEILWEYCLNTLGLSKPEQPQGKRDPNIHVIYRDKVTAIDIIRTNFGSSERYLKKIDIVRNKHNSETLLQVLADVWPRSKELSDLLDESQKSRRKCTYATAIRFFAIRADRPRMFREIIRIIRYCLYEPNFARHETLYPPILRRLQSDNILCSLLMRYINRTSNPSLKISIARLIHQAIRLTPELKEKLDMELSAQLPGKVEEGYDIVSGNFTSIPHAIFRMLETD